MLPRSEQTYFITSRSEGNSEEMSEVILSRWREDISGKGAELSRPSKERMSWRIPLASWGSVDVCSLSRAGMLFWPTYRAVSAMSGSDARVRKEGGGGEGRGPNKARGSLTVCADGLAGLVAGAPPRVSVIGRPRPLLAGGRVVRGYRDALPGGGPVGFVGAELGMLPLDAVLTGALVVALDLALATWPAGGAWWGDVSSVAHDGEWMVSGEW